MNKNCRKVFTNLKKASRKFKHINNKMLGDFFKKAEKKYLKH